MEPSFQPLPQFTTPHSFRLGVPSYVYPADILPNVEALAPYVDDIELVLFESRGPDDGRRRTDDRRRTTDDGYRTPDDGGKEEKQTLNVPTSPRSGASGHLAADVELPTSNAQCLTTTQSTNSGRSHEDNFSNIPSAETVARLAELARQHNLTYTVHFPIDQDLGSPDAGERRALQKQMLAIMDRTQPLRPFAYILHLGGIERDSTPTRIQTWQNDIAELLPALIERAGDPALICVENLNYPFDWCKPLLNRFGLGVCIDIGHLLVGGYDAEAHIAQHLPRTRVIHLHGVRDGHDHLALTALPLTRLRQLLNSIDKFTGVLTLEIFNYEKVRDSLAVLSEFWGRKQPPLLRKRSRVCISCNQ